MKIDKSQAEAIVKKLEAHVEQRRHRFAKIFYRGKLIAAFGIPRGSSKERGLGHIPRELGISLRQTVELADCTMTAEEYFQIALVRR